MKAFVIRFIKSFLTKYVSVEVLEDIVILLLRTLAKKTKTKIDDNIIEKLFGSEKENK